MKVKTRDFLVRSGTKVNLEEWPTAARPFFMSKHRDRKLLEELVEELRSLQRLHYASDRYAVLMAGLIPSHQQG